MHQMLLLFIFQDNFAADLTLGGVTVALNSVRRNFTRGHFVMAVWTRFYFVWITSWGFLFVVAA